MTVKACINGVWKDYTDEEWAKRESDSDYKYWSGYIGIDGAATPHTPLTEDELRKWSEDKNRLLVCIFCGWNKDNDISNLYCRRCKEYKGTVPLIEGWSVDKE